MFFNLQGWPLLLMLTAMVAYGACAVLRTPKTAVLSGLFGLGWLLHGWVLLADMMGWSRTDDVLRFGFGPALSGTVWLIVGLLSLESRWVPLPLVRRLWSGISILALVILAWAPVHMPLNMASSWMALHLALGMATYGVVGAAVLHAILLQMAERGMRQKLLQLSAPGLPILRLERLMFRLVLVGFGLLSGVLYLGWMSVLQNSWVWHWDHKSVFALLAWMVFAVLLMGHYALGWRGTRAAYAVYVGAGFLVLSYMGSRFVLEVLLQQTTG